LAPRPPRRPPPRPLWPLSSDPYNRDRKRGKLQIVIGRLADEAGEPLAGCYVVTTDVAPAAMSAQQVHDSYVSLAQVERDFRTLKTGLQILCARARVELGGKES